MYLGYQPDTIPGTVEKDKYIQDNNRILYPGLLKKINVPRI